MTYRNEDKDLVTPDDMNQSSNCNEKLPPVPQEYDSNIKITSQNHMLPVDVPKFNNTNLNNQKIDYSKDHLLSLSFLMFGLLFYIPLFFNVIYIRSPNSKARNCSLASVVIASVYTFTLILVFFVFLNQIRNFLFIIAMGNSNFNIKI